jgi:hypothetical protein
MKTTYHKDALSFLVRVDNGTRTRDNRNTNRCSLQGGIELKEEGRIVIVTPLFKGFEKCDILYLFLVTGEIIPIILNGSKIMIDEEFEMIKIIADVNDDLNVPIDELSLDTRVEFVGQKNIIKLNVYDVWLE